LVTRQRHGGQNSLLDGIVEATKPSSAASSPGTAATSAGTAGKMTDAQRMQECIAGPKA